MVGTDRTGHQKFLSPCTYFWLHLRAAAFSSFISSTLSEILLLTTLLESQALRICGLQYLLICSVLGPHILPSVSKHFIKTDKYRYPHSGSGEPKAQTSCLTHSIASMSQGSQAQNSNLTHSHTARLQHRNQRQVPLLGYTLHIHNKFF